MSIALVTVQAVGTGVVVIVVAVAVVLLVLPGGRVDPWQQKRAEQGRDATRRDLDEAHQRTGRAERDRDIAQEHAERPIDPDR